MCFRADARESPWRPPGRPGRALPGGVEDACAGGVCAGPAELAGADLKDRASDHSLSSNASLPSVQSCRRLRERRAASWAVSFERLLQDPLGVRYFSVSRGWSRGPGAVCSLRRVLLKKDLGRTPQGQQRWSRRAASRGGLPLAPCSSHGRPGLEGASAQLGPGSAWRVPPQQRARSLLSMLSGAARGERGCWEGCPAFGGTAANTSTVLKARAAFSLWSAALGEAGERRFRPPVSVEGKPKRRAGARRQLRRRADAGDGLVAREG